LPPHPHAALGSGGDEALGTPGATPRWWSGVFPAAQEAAPQTDYTEFDTYFFVPTAPEGDAPDFATLDTHSTAAADFDRQSVQFSDDDREPANAEAPASGEHAQPGPTPDGDAVPVGHLPRGGGDRAGHTLSALDDQPQASNAQDEEQIEEEDEDPPAPQIARRLSASLTERQTLPPGQPSPWRR